MWLKSKFSDRNIQLTSMKLGCNSIIYSYPLSTLICMTESGDGRWISLNTLFVHTDFVYIFKYKVFQCIFQLLNHQMNSCKVIIDFAFLNSKKRSSISQNKIRQKTNRFEKWWAVSICTHFQRSSNSPSLSCVDCGSVWHTNQLHSRPHCYNGIGENVAMYLAVLLCHYWR